MSAGDAGGKRESADDADSDAAATARLGRRSFLTLAGVLSALGLAGFRSPDVEKPHPDTSTLTTVTYGYGGTPVVTSKASQTSATATQSAASATSVPTSKLEDEYGEQGYGEYGYGG